jgi:hypothetical protein
LQDRLHSAGLELDATSLSRFNSGPLAAMVSVDQASGAFLSPEGLVLTAHHVAYGSIQYRSTPERDLLTQGFLARARTEELPAAPGSRITVIEDSRDVTEAMTRGITANMKPLARNARLKANREALVSACEKRRQRRCEVKEVFGAQYELQQQLEIKDVRLVYAPANGVGYFGGETDNWMWPRHTGDFAFYRAYVAPDGSSAVYAKENIPYRPKAWLKIARQGLNAGDFVMVAGFPRKTQRLQTASEVRFAFQTYYPAYRARLEDAIEVLERAIAGDADAMLRYAAVLRDLQNAHKKISGQMAGAERSGLVTAKAAQEHEYRVWIAADPARRRYQEAAVALDQALAEDQRAQMESLAANELARCQLLAAARTLYRWAQERDKDDAIREDGYRDRDRRAVEESLTQLEKRWAPAVDRKVCDAAIRAHRGSGHGDAAFLAKLDVMGLDQAYGHTELAQTSRRLTWLDKPAAAFEASQDPLVQLAITLSRSDSARERAAQERSARIQAARAIHTHGMLEFSAQRGQPLYADANGSLRFTYGKVLGKHMDGQQWTAFTTAEGLLAKHTGKGEFAAPARLIERIRTKDYGRYAAPSLGTLPVNFLSTVDIAGGNSGSATLNARGELVGVVFDRTLDGVISDWGYDAASNRTIHVDSRFLLWVMEKVDGAGHLIKEIEERAD